MKLMAIDGNSILNRAYYGIRPLSTRDGLYTHAVYGFLTTLLRLRDEERPDAVCVAFDLHAPTFRHKADADYKATRKPMPEELRMQVPVLKEVLDTSLTLVCSVMSWRESLSPVTTTQSQPAASHRREMVPSQSSASQPSAS